MHIVHGNSYFNYCPLQLDQLMDTASSYRRKYNRVGTSRKIRYRLAIAGIIALILRKVVARIREKAKEKVRIAQLVLS